MDKATSVLGALDAGKFPDQKQINQAIDWVLSNGIPEVEPSGGGQLSEQGRVIAGGVREVLKSYKELGSNKNGDDILQNAMWHLAQGDLQNTNVDAVNSDEAANDLKKIRSALRTILKVGWINVSSEGSALLEDFASFMRLALADFAGVIENQAGKAKDGLRTLDTQVNEGERTQLGFKQKSPEEQERDSDPKVQWQNGMDTVKDAGTVAIGTGQDAKAKAEETADRTSTRVHDAYIQICDRAQNDPNYHDAMVTLFDTISKWLNRSVDTADSVKKNQTTLEDFINDPTPEQHVPKAIRLLQTFLERLAGGKSVDPLVSKLNQCAVDVRADKDLKAWFDDFFAHVRKSLDQAGYARSDEAEEKYKDLRKRWKALTSNESDKGRKWKSDTDALKTEIRAFESALSNDKDLNRVKKAHVKLGDKVGDGMAEAGSASLSFAMDQSSWFWQDIFSVYAPRVTQLLKDIPIPRTEYVDAETEFVLENLDISTFNLLPGHVYIRNITDVDITAPASGTTTTAVGTLTHIKIQAMQIALKDVSFFYKDKTATVGPSEFTGLMEFTLPKQGIDVDIKVRMLPNTPEGLKQRTQRGGYHLIERVEVNVAEDVTLNIKESNHSILIGMFKPVVLQRLRQAIAMTLAEQMRGILETADAVAWDIGRRSEVFSDTGLGTGASIAAAIWSEIGRFRKMDGSGLMTGWQATGTGFVKEDLANEGKLAVGAEPQILSGEKKGPLGTNSQSLAERLPEVDVDMDANSAQEAGQEVAQRAVDLTKEGAKQVQSFQASVQRKSAEEKKTEGWKSEAFNLE